MPKKLLSMTGNWLSALIWRNGIKSR